MVSLPPGVPGPDPILPIDQQLVDALDAIVSPVFGWLQDVVHKLDLSLDEATITAAATAAETAAGAVKDAIESASGALTSAFDAVEQALDELDPGAVTGPLE